MSEAEFLQEYGQLLTSAHQFLARYQVSGLIGDISQVLSVKLFELCILIYSRPSVCQAWDLYYKVFRSINKTLPSLMQLELQVHLIFFLSFVASAALMGCSTRRLSLPSFSLLNTWS